MVLGIVVGGLVAVAVAAVVFALMRPATTWDINTPQGTVQAYLSAVVHGDREKGARYLDPRSPCDVRDLDQVDGGSLRGVDRVDLAATTVEGDVARVEVTVAYTGGGPVGPGVTEDHTFRLTRTTAGGTWLIAGTPWPLYSCGGGVK